MEEIDKFKKKMKNINELIIDTMEHDFDKLIYDFNIAK